jgi:hypothetical protein
MSEDSGYSGWRMEGKDLFHRNMWKLFGVMDMLLTIVNYGDDFTNIGINKICVAYCMLVIPKYIGNTVVFVKLVARFMNS